MKRFLCIVLALAMCLSLAACGGQGHRREPTDSSAPRVAKPRVRKNKNETDTLTKCPSLLSCKRSASTAQNIVTNQVLTNIYDGLLMLDQDANLSPQHR